MNIAVYSAKFSIRVNCYLIFLSLLLFILVLVLVQAQIHQVVGFPQVLSIRFLSKRCIPRLLKIIRIILFLKKNQGQYLKRMQPGNGHTKAMENMSHQRQKRVMCRRVHPDRAHAMLSGMGGWGGVSFMD